MSLEYFAIALYMATLVVIGLVASRRTRNMRDYYAGGKNMGFLAVAFSSRATGESAWLLLGLTGFGAAYGMKGFWVVLGELLGVGLAWLWLSRRFKRLTDEYDSVTVPDYLESRFRDTSHGLRLIAAGALAVFVPIYVSSNIHATGVAFREFLGWNYYAGAILGFSVVALYITRGGFIAVVWSDVFQGTLMVLGLVGLPLAGIFVAGGVGPILDSLRENYPGHLTATGGEPWNAMTIFSIVGLSAIGIGFLGSPQVFVRFISLRSEKEIPRGAALAIAWTLLADSGAVLAGMVGRALIGGDLGEGSQNILPMMVDAWMPAFFVGLYIAIVLSAIMSTIDSLLVVASSAVVRDFYQKTRHPEIPDEQLMRVSRRVTATLALSAFAIAMGVAWLNEEQEIFWFIIFGWSGIAATFCPTIILSLFWSKMTARGAKAGMITGFFAVPFIKWGLPAIWESSSAALDQLDVLAPAFLLSALAIVIVSGTESRA